MKKLLFLLGLGGLGYGAYYYITQQLKLALNWDFKVSDFKILSITSKGADIDLIISVLNKSLFAVDVKNYDIDILYRGVPIAKAQSDNPFTVQSDSWFDVPTSAFINFDSAKGILGELGTTLLNNKPISITVRGKLNIVFSGINKQIILNQKDVVVSQNSADDLGLSKPINKVKDFLDKLGIKI